MNNIMMLHNGRCGSTVVGNLLAQNPNIHWASELYTPLFEKWKKEHPNRFPVSEQKTIVENPIEILKNSMNETTNPYYGVAIKPVQLVLIGFLLLQILLIFNLFSFQILLTYSSEAQCIFGFCANSISNNSTATTTIV